MLSVRRSRSGGQPILTALAVIALMLKLLVPAGFMPGTSLSQPIMLCPDQGAMPMMAMAAPGDHAGPRAPAGHHHNDGDHPCPFASIATGATVADPEAPVVPPVLASRVQPVGASYAIVPGRGLAAPPPPSHAPPVARA